MNIPGIGELHKNDDGQLLSAPVLVRAFGGRPCTFLFEGLETDEFPEDLLDAAKNILAADERLLDEATPHVYQYYMDVLALAGDDAPALSVEAPRDVWRHVDLGDELTVTRDYGLSRDAFVSLECNCAWEVEHGLQLVFKNGRSISKVGMFDGHVSNESAYADPSLKDVVYRWPRRYGEGTS